MPHNWKYDVGSLREQVASTIATFKLEKDRLRNVQLKKTDDLEFSDRKVIMNWSRASIADFSEKLDHMEEVDQPSVEERQISDIQGEVVKRLDAKFGKVKWMAVADLPEGAYMREDGKMVIPRKKKVKTSEMAPAAAPVEAASSSSTLGSLPLPPLSAPPALQAPFQPASEIPAPVAKAPQVTICDAAEEQQDSNDGPEQASSKPEATDGSTVHVSNPDPEGIYALLGLPPQASMEQIRKAARKMTVTLHPDKNTGDPDAGIKFAEFITLYRETLDGEEKRQAYDTITPDQLVELTKRVRALTVGGAPPA
ncbi:hypothetical protein LTR36_007501 [Oleoguttula mirabilis]|uniref:J domain-containing protein n=1 Tax=Oleoguttula mirabilis TaxID=1507867 RepID=A0AAV9JUS4_9PEZI|nr:hypothetical protein LTR36_007501 [Oleoguttula mirabilis]